MKLEQFEKQVRVPTHLQPSWVPWYEVGMPAVLVATVISMAQNAYRSFSTDLPALPQDHHRSDLFAVLRNFKQSRVGARNLPTWTTAFEELWAKTTCSGQPFCMADVVAQLPHSVKAYLVQKFSAKSLEVRVHPTGHEKSTSLAHTDNIGLSVTGTLRAAMWLEFPDELRAMVRANVTTWDPALQTSALESLKELDTIPVTRYQLDWRTFWSYRRLAEQFDGFYGDWSDLPAAYKNPILDFVYQNAGLDGLDASEYSSYNMFSRCGGYPDDKSFCRWVQKVHSELDTSNLAWLLELSKLEPNPEKIVENWETLKPKLVEVLYDIGRDILSHRVGRLNV